ncbi:hypothetical protein ACFOFO_16460 [Undibacterium arcticum]|uniref:Uncharacterized protein n=1 Tax=Undibacterium arcticum TaxID=1762892 RepID=A0ABV7F5H9_9BURK
MSSFAIVHASQPGAASAYAKNLSQAGRAFLAALIAFKPQQSAEPALIRDLSVSPGDRANDMQCLNRLANEYASIMPNLSAELRFLASRG